MNILVVEDNALLAMLMEQDLADAGMNVVGPCSSSNSALEHVHAQPCDAALIDIDLSDGRTGGELAKKLNAEFEMPVIFVTGQRQLALEYSQHALGILQKPFVSEDLIAAIEGLRAEKAQQKAHFPKRFEHF